MAARAPMTGELMGIGEFARRSRLPVSTLRYYHQIGVFPPAEVDAATGYRRYSPQQLPIAGVVDQLRRAGVSPDVIAELTGTPAAAQELLRRERQRIETDITEAHAALDTLQRVEQRLHATAPSSPHRTRARPASRGGPLRLDPPTTGDARRAPPPRAAAPQRAACSPRRHLWSDPPSRPGRVDVHRGVPHRAQQRGGDARTPRWSTRGRRPSWSLGRARLRPAVGCRRRGTRRAGHRGLPPGRRRARHPARPAVGSRYRGLIEAIRARSAWARSDWPMASQISAEVRSQSGSCCPWRNAWSIASRASVRLPAA